MIDLRNIEELESCGTTIHAHYDGREIQREFHVFGLPREGTPSMRHNMAPSVAEAMLGFLEHDMVAAYTPWTRHVPAQHPSYPDCYCNEVKINQIHPAANSPSATLGLSNLHAEASAADAHARFMTQINSIGDDPAGGAFLTASYRPLNSAYLPAYTRHEEDARIFDWMDPQFTPAVRTVPWPDGLVTAAKDRNAVVAWHPAVPDEVAQPVNIPVSQFTVKRLLVGEVDYERLNELLNTVNKDPWPDPANVPGNYRISPFPTGTLRFDDFEVKPHYSPATAGGIWWELVYHFSWLDYMDKPVFGKDGEKTGIQGWDHVTWNHVLMRPSKIFELFQEDLGWYFVAKAEERFWYLTGRQAQIGPLYSFAEFDPLFMLNPPP